MLQNQQQNPLMIMNGDVNAEPIKEGDETTEETPVVEDEMILAEGF